MPETETSTWDEYRILCADGEVRHGISRPTVRAFALDRILQQDKFPHQERQALIPSTEHSAKILHLEPST